MKFKCQQCGNCCKTININVGYSDILRWAKEQRYDILSKITYVESDENGRSDFYIRDTVTVKDCPFLGWKGGLSFCTIHDTKPLGCKDAPLAYDTQKLEKFDCPAKPFDYNEREAHELWKAQSLNIQIAHDRKDELIGILEAVKAIGEGIEKVKAFGKTLRKACG